MFNSLLTKVVEAAAYQAHSHPMGIWWYDRENHKLSYSIYRGQCHDRSIEGAGVTKIRGRVFKDSNTGMNTAMVWTGWNVHTPIVRLTQDELQDIAKQLQVQIKEPIQQIVDEDGTNLIQERRG